VCRARLAEGIDFKDSQARLVIVIGMPIPNIADPYVILKRQFLKSKFNSDDYLNTASLRAVNQSVGRLIRHKDDYGAIVLCEARWLSNGGKAIEGLSSWMRNRVQFGQDVDDICSGISTLVGAHNFEEEKESVQRSGCQSESELQLDSDNLDAIGDVIDELEEFIQNDPQEEAHVPQTRTSKPEFNFKFKRER